MCSWAEEDSRGEEGQVEQHQNLPFFFNSTQIFEFDSHTHTVLENQATPMLFRNRHKSQAHHWHRCPSCPGQHSFFPQPIAGEDLVFFVPHARVCFGRLGYIPKPNHILCLGRVLLLCHGGVFFFQPPILQHVRHAQLHPPPRIDCRVELFYPRFPTVSWCF